ncbi:MAG: hypothetical protein KC492_12165, partial [Myxococcales bacterium]|nr:hypothetical protein [Myxococcales bacterium]
LRQWSDELFSWPLDAVSNRGFGYHISVAVTKAWNSEGRASPCGEFFGRWLAEPGNVEAAMDEARASWRAGCTWGIPDAVVMLDLGVGCEDDK